MTHSQAQNTPKGEDKWTEIIEDLWKVHLPHFQDEVKVYDDDCLKLDCVTLQYGDDEESESDGETWLDQDIEDSTEETIETKETEEESKLSAFIYICTKYNSAVARVLRAYVFFKSRVHILQLICNTSVYGQY